LLDCSSGPLGQALTPRDKDTGKVVFQEVVQVEGADAKELRTRAKTWVATTFHSAKDVIQQDEESRLILRTVHPFTKQEDRLESSLWMTITVEFKDGRYRYQITDIVTTPLKYLIRM